MLHVGFVGTFAASLEAPIRRRLSMPCDIVIGDEEGIMPRLPGVDVLVTMVVTAAMAGACSRLKLVQVPGAGLDRIDRSALPAGIALANVHGHETAIAEYVIGAMLALTRDFLRLDPALRKGEWRSQWAVGAPPPAVWPELAGKTLGILGYGRIGRAVAQRARAFDMQIRAVSRSAKPAIGDDPVLLGGPESIDAVLTCSDYVLLSLPLTPATLGAIDRRRLARLKRTAFVINVARAEIVDEDALFDALDRAAVAGAALDVWYRYPQAPGPAAPARRPFHELSNVLLTPHVAGWTDGTLDARATLIAENIRRVAAGETPLNLVAA